MKFILTSNSYSVTKSWIKEFGIKPSDMKVAFIDTAAEVYDKDEADWLNADREALVKVGFSVIDYTLSGKTKENLQEDLSKFDVFFVSGGNSFYLLEKALKSGFVSLIKENYFSEKIYVGSSAGSVLLSNDIDIIKFLDNPDKANLETTKAIGILNFVILPHWGNDHFKLKYRKLLNVAYEKAIGGITLADNEYLTYFSNQLKLVKV